MRRAAFQRLVAGRGRKLNHRLKGRSARDEVDYVLGDVRQRGNGGDINRWGRPAHLNHCRFNTNGDGQVERWKVTYLENQPHAVGS